MMRLGSEKMPRNRRQRGSRDSKDRNRDRGVLRFGCRADDTRGATHGQARGRGRQISMQAPKAR